MRFEPEHSALPVIPGLLPWQSCFLAFGLGILGYRHSPGAWVTLIVLIVCDTGLRGWPRRIPALVFVLCALFGFGYAAQRSPDPAVTPEWMESGRPAMVEAIVDAVEPRSEHRLRIVLSDVTCRIDEQPVSLPGKLIWNWRSPDRIPSPGQAVSGQMRIRPVRGFINPGAWDYGWYWRRQGVLWTGWPADRNAPMQWGDSPESRLWALKSGLRQTVATAVPDTPGGALVRALLTGDRSGLDQETTRAIRSAGLAHTLALSGLHVGFVAAMGMGLAWLVGLVYPPVMLSIPRLKLGVLLAVPLVGVYVWLGQPSQSLIRAATMFAFWGYLLLQGRGRVLVDGLFFALAIIVFVSPLSLFDLGLQMSCLAVAGIGLIYPLLRRLFTFPGAWWKRCLGWAGGVLGLSLSANLALLPLISWTFGSFSPNILFNLLWLPVLGAVVMPLGLLGMVLTGFSWSFPAGSMLLHLAALVMNWLVEAVVLADGASLTPVFSVLRPLWPEIIGGGLLLVAGVLAVINQRVCVGMAGLGFVLLTTPHLSVMAADTVGEVRLSLIDVGQSQAVSLSLPGGHRWLIDAGGGSSRFDMGEAVVAPYLTQGRPPRLDGVIMSHPDVDHSRGVPFILDRFAVGTFYSNGMKPVGETGKRLRRVMEAREIEPVVLHAGQSLNLGGDTVIEVVHPPFGFTASQANERSLVLRVVRGGKGLALLPGDVEQMGINALLASGSELSAEVLVLPHHGSRRSLSPALYRAVDADVAVCSAGYLNRYMFPHREVGDGLDCPLFVTSRHGLITAIWDTGGVLSVKVASP